MPKLKLLLLDANVIIDAHIHGIWESLKQVYEIAVPSIIANEARFFVSSTGSAGIDLKAQAGRGEIAVIEGTLSDINDAFAGINPAFMAGIHSGEQEAISLICCGKCEGYSFCTGDTNAIEAMGYLKLGDRSVSFENVVSGLKLKKKLMFDPSLTERAHADHLKAGDNLRVSGVYAVPVKKKKKST